MNSPAKCRARIHWLELLLVEAREDLARAEEELAQFDYDSYQEWLERLPGCESHVRE